MFFFRWSRFGVMCSTGIVVDVDITKEECIVILTMSSFLCGLFYGLKDVNACIHHFYDTDSYFIRKKQQEVPVFLYRSSFYNCWFLCL